jgi:prepilin peptidase CpaA
MLAAVASVPALALPALVLTAAASDALSFKIPNWISLALLALFPVAALAAGLPLTVIGLHFGIGLVALVAGMAMFALRWLGGGDAKLFAAVALWMGWPAVGTFLALAAVAGGALAAVLLLLRSATFRPLALLGPRWVVRLAEPGEGVPYGVAIAIGALVAFPGSPLVSGLAL